MKKEGGFLLRIELSANEIDSQVLFAQNLDTAFTFAISLDIMAPIKR